MSRIVFEAWNEFLLVVKGLELRVVYVRSNECRGSAEAAIFTIFSE